MVMSFSSVRSQTNEENETKKDYVLSVILRAMNFNTSSMRMTGKDIFSTAIHSSSVSGVIWNTACKRTHRWRTNVGY